MSSYLQRLLCCLVLVCGIHGAALAKPECPASEKGARPDQERARNTFPGEINVSTSARKDRHVFDVSLTANLPQLTRVKLSLYYVTGDPPTEELAGEKIRRVSGNGGVNADFLGLKRELWAGCYRLVVHFHPNQQVPSVLRKLDGSENPVRREKNWYHGTPARRERQENRAMERARRDFRQFLLLSGQLKRFVMARADSNKRYKYLLTPYGVRVRTPQYWLIWSAQWKRRLKTLQSSNKRRPRFEGRPISFFFMESRAAYFLQTYLEGLEELFAQSNKMMWRYTIGEHQVNQFREAYRTLRTQVIRTMKMIGLTVPLSQEQESQLERILEGFNSHLDRVSQQIDRPGSNLNQERRTKIRSHLQQLQSLLFRVDASMPDLLYQEVFDLSRRLQKLNARMATIGPDQLQTSVREVYQKFTTIRDLTHSFMNQSPDTSGKQN